MVVLREMIPSILSRGCWCLVRRSRFAEVVWEVSVLFGMGAALGPHIAGVVSVREGQEERSAARADFAVALVAAVLVIWLVGVLLTCRYDEMLVEPIQSTNLHLDLVGLHLRFPRGSISRGEMA